MSRNAAFGAQFGPAMQLFGAVLVFAVAISLLTGPAAGGYADAGPTAPGDAQPAGTTAERTVDNGTVAPGETTTVTVNATLGTDVEFLALQESFAPVFADAELVSVSLDGEGWVPAVTPESLSVFYDAEDASVVPAGSDVEFAYEVTAPSEPGSHALQGALVLVETDGEERQVTIEDDMLRVGQGVATYTNAEGVVDTPGLQAAIDDWQNGDIDTSLLRDVIDAWQSGDPVT